MGQLGADPRRVRRSCARSRCSRSPPARRTRTRASSPTRSRASTRAQVYEVAGKLMAKLRAVPAASRRSSRTYFDHTPNLDIEIRREQATTLRRLRDAHPGAAAQRLLAELPLPDQEARGPVPGDPRGRRTRPASTPEDLALLYIRSDDGKSLVPLARARRTGSTSLGPQSVNHLNQFTSVTIFFNLHARRRRSATRPTSSTQGREGGRPADRARQPPGRGADVPRHGRRPDDPDGARGLRDVRDPRHPLRELPAPADGALDAADRARRRAADALRSSASRRRSTRSSACSC